MKITNEQSRQIYELSKDINNKPSNRKIGEMFGIDEALVRYHVKRWEGKLHEIAKTNEKAASALANHVVDVHSETMAVLKAVKDSIAEAKTKKVSPEKLAPLYSNWIKSLEFASELLGEINKNPVVNIQINEQFNNFMDIILSEVNEVDRARIISKLRPNAIY